MSPKIDNSVTWPGWHMVRLIGEGSFGNVYEIQRKEGSNVFKAALKVIRIPKDPTETRTLRAQGLNISEIQSIYEDRVQNIREEYALMAKVRGCPNIVYYDDHKIERDKSKIGWTILIKMELLKPFKDYIKSVGLSEALVKRTGIALCKALEACHTKNILHRDIKPDNMFINEYGIIKLGDFGIARSIKELSAGDRAGSYSYMAPEIYYGTSVGFASDIYSAGIVLYRMLNDNVGPFEPVSGSAEDIQEAQNMRLSGNPLPTPRHGNPAMKTVVMKALAFNPDERYQSAAEMMGALGALSVSKRIFDDTGNELPVILVCPLCGSRLLEKSSFCPVCGYPLKPSDSQPALLTPKNSNKAESPVLSVEPYKAKSNPALSTIIIILLLGINLLFAVIYLTPYFPTPHIKPDIGQNPFSLLLIFTIIAIFLLIILLIVKTFGKGKAESPQLYDVFISFKHSENGNDLETPDSKMAEQLYKDLTAADLKVFFSKITLPGKGVSDFKSELEKALKHSSVLVVVSTSLDNLNSDWVSWEIKTYYNYLTAKNKKYIPKEMYCYLSRQVDKTGLPPELLNRTCFANTTEAVVQITNRLNKPTPDRASLENQEYNVNRVWNDIGPNVKLSNGRYALLRQLKKRQYYVLFSAYDYRLDKECIIKIINRYTISKEFVDPEIALLKSLGSYISGIPLIYDYDDSSPDILYSVMSFVPGSSLEENLNTGQTIIEKDLITWMIRLSEILDQLHNAEESIVHCNVQPSNIFLGPNRHISLINFSCAYRLRGHTELNKYRGVSKKFAAPELINAEYSIDRRTDIFSVGYVMLYMLCGRNQIIFDGIIYPQSLGISPELSSVICKCMAYIPEDRYPDCSKLIQDLRKIQDGQYTIPKNAPQFVDLSFTNEYEHSSSNDMTVILSEAI